MSIYIADENDPFVQSLKNYPMPEIPEDAINLCGNMPGELHPSYGLKHTEEAKQKMRKPRSEKGKHNIAAGVKKFWDEVGMSQETIEKIRATCTGQKRTEESREKMRKNALRKNPCPHCGRLMNAGGLVRHIKAQHSTDK